MYEDCPCIVTVHPYKLQAYRTDQVGRLEVDGRP